MSSLTGEKVRLRAIEPEDADAFHRWHHDEDVTRWLDVGFPESLDAIRRRFADRPANTYDRAVFGIELLDGARLIGVCVLRDAVPSTARAELDVYIGEKDCWNGGYGTDALRVLCRYGFDFMRLHSISLGVVADNERAKRVYEKVGFVVEGRERESFRRDGQWLDVFQMGLLAREFIR